MILRLQMEVLMFEPELLKTLLRPQPATDMESCRVSKLVNRAKNDRPECIAPG
jgi:putative SOS response-associated peptidase YedK